MKKSAKTFEQFLAYHQVMVQNTLEFDSDSVLTIEQKIEAVGELFLQLLTNSLSEKQMDTEIIVDKAFIIDYISDVTLALNDLGDTIEAGGY